VTEHAKMRSQSVEHAIATLPTSKCGTTLERAKNDYLAERKASLKDST
jgi:hypothetical protein